MADMYTKATATLIRNSLKKNFQLLFTLLINNDLSFPVPCNSEVHNTNQCFFKVWLSSELFITYLLSSYFVCNVLYLAAKDPVFASL